MTTLTEFLLARIAEDEAVAREVQDKVRPDRREWPTYYEDAEGASATAYFDRDYHQGGYTITAARVLAECEAKRRIVESFADAERAVATYDHDNPVPAYWQEWGNRHALASVLESLAAVYAEHPSFDPSWRLE